MHSRDYMEMKEAPWIHGIVRYVDQNKNVVEFDGDFIRVVETGYIILAEGDQIRIVPEERLFEIVVKRDDYESRVAEMFSSRLRDSDTGYR
jgi:hypothetical protein